MTQLAIFHVSILAFAGLASHSCKHIPARAPATHMASIAPDDQVETADQLRTFIEEQGSFYISDTKADDKTSDVAQLRSMIAKNSRAKLQVREGLNRLAQFYEYITLFDQRGAFSLAHTATSGAPMPDKQYLAAIKTIIKVPQWLNSPATLANITPDGSRDDVIRSELKTLNESEGRQGANQILFIRFAENKLGSGDPREAKRDIADRSLFFIPARNVKTEMDYAAMFSGINTMSLIAVDRSEALAKSYYYDHSWDPSGVVTPNRPKFANSCFFCHKSGGFFPIYPDLSKPHDPQSLADLKIFNAHIRETGVAHHPVYDQAPSHLPYAFPALDSAGLDAARIDELIAKQKFALPYGVDLEGFKAKVAKTEKCSQCHSDNHEGRGIGGAKSRAAMRPPMASPLRMVKLGIMPPRNGFTAEEAEAFAALLEVEYRERIINYFLGGAL